MNDACADLFRFLRHESRCIGVNRAGERFFPFSLVNGSVSGCVDDQVRTNPTNNLPDFLGLRQVQLVTIERDDFAHARQKMREFTADLTVLAREQNFDHHVAEYLGSSSCEISASFDNLASLSETTGLSTPQEIFRSGSFQAIPCSSSAL